MGKPRNQKVTALKTQAQTALTKKVQEMKEALQKPALPLQHRQESFKLIVESALEDQIRFLCDKLPTKEYSGTLFYKVTGSFETKDLVIHAKDFYLQDVGVGGYTEFQHDASLAGYMVDHELWDCYTGLMHSHNQMSTFFSGTDVNTLRSEGTEQNHFVSLIVNNEGKYSAAVTRKVHTKMVKKIFGSRHDVYRTWGDETIDDSRPFESEENTEGDYFEYFDLKVEIEKGNYKKSELELRLEELSRNPKSTTNKGFSPFPEYTIHPAPQKQQTTPQKDTNPFQVPAQKVEEPTIFSKEDMDAMIGRDSSIEEVDWDAIPYGKDHIIPELIKEQVKQIVSGNIFAHMQQKFDLVGWSKNMERVYDKRFIIKGATSDNDNDTFMNFEIFADGLIELLNGEIDIDDMEELSDEAMISGPDYVDAIWAYDLTQALKKLPENRYVNYFIKSLERWII